MKESIKEFIEQHESTNVNVPVPGISACGLLGVLLIVLKLTGNITLSWTWVLAPFWIPMLIAVVLIAVTVGLVAWLYNGIEKSTENVETDNSINTPSTPTPTVGAPVEPAKPALAPVAETTEKVEKKVKKSRKKKVTTNEESNTGTKKNSNK